jgi:penicillin amidase
MRASHLHLAAWFTSLVVLASACSKDDDITYAQPTGGVPTGSGGSGGGGGGLPEGVSIPGLSDKVQAVYDEHGILHLTSKTDQDGFAALGYFHAQNRFFFMDFVRNVVRGSLGALVKAGSTVLERDYVNRQWFTTLEGEPLEQALYDNASPEVRSYLDAYTRGVNAWIADMKAGRNGATLTTEYDFALIVKENIRDWDVADSTAVGLYVLDDLSNNSASELAMAAELPLFDPAFAADLFSAEPVFDAFTLPAANTQSANLWSPPSALAPLHLFSEARDRLRQVGSGARGSGADVGSNNWVVGPSQSASGNALLANDPHLSLTNPSIWFPVELDAKTDGTGSFHVAGSTFPGLPAVLVGQNETIGWGVTTTYYDLADVYVETLSADGKAVLFDGNEVPILEKEFAFDNAANGKTEMKTFRWVPHHGPIVSEDAAAGTAITIRWRGQDAGTDLDAFFGLGLATNIEEGRVALTKASSAAQNFVLVDTSGGIGWYPYSELPSRPWASQALPPWLPLPGDGTAEWQGVVPFGELPQATNPPAGMIATANQDMTGASADGDPLNDGQTGMQAYDKADGTRLQRILDRLADGAPSHTVDTMHDIQGDTYSLYGEIFVPAALAAAENATLTADEQAVIDALKTWSFTCPTGLDGSDPATAGLDPDPVKVSESVGCSAAHALVAATVGEALGDEIAESGSASSGRWSLYLVARALRDPSQIATGDLLWDDVSTPGNTETRDEILLRAIGVAATHLALTGTPDTWQWGRLHTLTLRSIFDSFGVTTYNDGPHAAPGGLFTVNVASPSTRVPDEGKPFDFSFAHGASVRFVIEADPSGPRMTYELPGGTDLHRESPFYNNLLPGWLTNEPIPFAFGKGAVTNPALTVEVSPGG